jgi:hypothetical protein
MPRWSELVCDLELALVMCDLDRERRSQARPSGLVSGQAWRAVGAPCSVVRAALYVIRWPRSSGRDPRSVARGSRIGDLLSSMVGVRDPWRVLRQLARVGLDARSIGLDPVLDVRDPRAVARGACMFLLALVVNSLRVAAQKNGRLRKGRGKCPISHIGCAAK